ncbi:MAG: hypothetical protein H8K03_21125 [Nitrospira sp.]|jgi:hypothetical protein|nr:hypothetical protein [Nitrospira sp. BO4]
MESIRDEIRQFAVASERLIIIGTNPDDLSKRERETIQHYLAMLAAKFPAVLGDESPTSSS